MAGDNDRQLAAAVMATLVREDFHCELRRLASALRRDRVNAFRNTSDLEDFLCDFPGNFHISDSSGAVNVYAHTNLEVCPDHYRRDGCDGECDRLHICKFFLLSKKCSFGNCQFGHSLKSPHNQRLLTWHNLQYLSTDDLGELYCIPEVRQCNDVLIPQWCKFYNSQRGCDKYEQCGNLHVCSFYITNSCKFGRMCRRNHDLDEGVMHLLARYGISVNRPIADVLEELRFLHSAAPSSRMSPVSPPPPRQMYRPNIMPLSLPMYGQSFPPPSPSRMPPSPGSSYANYGGARPKNPRSQQSERRARSHSRGPQIEGASVSRARSKSRGPQAISNKEESTQICIHELQNKCFFKERCFNHHCPFIYQWQVGKDGSQWSNLDAEANEDAEKNFCTVEKSECFARWNVGLLTETTLRLNFDTMTASDGQGQSYDIRRLSTVTSVSGLPPSLLPWATEWRWYFQDDQKWIPYGEKGSQGYKASVTSKEIEEKFHENPKSSLRFSTKPYEYKLDFGLMIQSNVELGTRRHVRRRPVFVHKDDIKKRQQQGLEVKAVVPDTWSSEARALATEEQLSSHFKLEEVGQGSTEFNEVADRFNKTMKRRAIVQRVHRLENGELWLSYNNKKKQMTRKAKGKVLEEKQLFHGTHKEYIEAITRQGFDPRLSGKSVGTMWGKGSYFARDAKYSSAYCKSSGSCKMFLVNVLAGEYTQGSSSYSRPPPKSSADPHGDLFDSCVDDMNDPSIFVIFTLDQVYPQYVITYMPSNVLKL